MAISRAELYHNVAQMLRSGLPVLRALEIAAKTARGPMRRALRGIHASAAAGESLGAAMTRYPGVFPPLEVLVVEAAETSGHLPESLEHLSQYYAFRDRLRSTALSGLALPVAILHVAALVIPLPGFFMEGASTAGYFLQVLIPLLFLYVPIMAIFIVVRYTPKTGPLRTLLDEVTLMVPLLGRAASRLALSRFCRTFQMLYATGTVPIAECVRKAAELSGNTIIRRRLIGGARSAEAGQAIGEGFPASLPAEFVASWQVGEESGKLDDTAVRLADQYAENSERLMALLAVWIPRLVYALVSLYLVYNIFRMFSAVYGPIMNPESSDLLKDL